MANTFNWYLCPYDVTKEKTMVLRRPAIARYIPSVPNGDNANWDEAETMGNHLIVKVFAPQTLHDQIQADPDFVRFDLSETTVPAPLRNAVKKKLTDLGFTDQEVNDTNWVVTAILDLLTTARGVFQINETGDRITLLSGRKAPSKLIADIERRLPG